MRRYNWLKDVIIRQRDLNPGSFNVEFKGIAMSLPCFPHPTLSSLRVKAMTPQHLRDNLGGSVVRAQPTFGRREPRLYRCNLQSIDFTPCHAYQGFSRVGILSPNTQ